MKYFLGVTIIYLASAWIITEIGILAGSRIAIGIGIIMGWALLVAGWWVWLAVLAVLVLVRIVQSRRRRRLD